MPQILRPFLERWRLCAVLAAASMLAIALFGQSFVTTTLYVPLVREEVVCCV